MSDDVTVRAEDVVAVRTRVGWGAIFAGAMVALALNFLLMLVGAAIGLSLSGQARAEDIGIGVIVWAIVSALASLFVGGFITSQLTVGENKGEAVIYGVILWGVVFGLLMALTATGVRSSFSALVGLSNVRETVAGDAKVNWETAARQAGVPQTTVDEWKRQAAKAPDTARNTVEDPQNRQAALDVANRMTWWVLLGTVLSMAASVGGAVLGAGPTLRLMTLAGAPAWGERYSTNRREALARR